VSEACALVLAQLDGRAGFVRRGAVMRCPDGREVDLEAAPLVVMGRLVQEDFCLLHKPQGCSEHVLSAAVLCFPASWTLAEKIGRPLGRIHAPVEGYAGAMQTRVQRLLDGVQIGRPLWRSNLISSGATLFMPKREADKPAPQEGSSYLRAERQTLLRLPQSGAVLFSIRTYVARSPDQ